MSSASKPTVLTDSFLCEKDGHAPRTFTMHQLEAMGTDPNGITHDGWRIVDEPVEPIEVKEAKEKSKSQKGATKIKADSHANTGKTEGSGGSDDSSAERTGGEGSAQGSEGDSDGH